MTKKKNLSATLSDYQDQLKTAYPEFSEGYQNIVDRLVAAGAGSSSPRAGDTLPPFQLPDDRGRLVNLSDLLEDGPLVVSMNRGHWCAFCRYELTELQRYSVQIKNLGANIIAISPEKQAYATKFRDKCGLSFPVLCDVDNGYALSLGLAIWIGDEIKRIFEGFGNDLELFQGNSAWMLPIPATYVVGTDGKIADCFVDPDFRKRLEPEDMISALKAL